MRRLFGWLATILRTGAGAFHLGIKGGNFIQLTRFSSDLAIKHDWAPDGQRLLITVDANFFHPGESANTATVRLDGADFRYLTHFRGGNVNDFFGSYSPDGQGIVFRHENHDRYGLYRMRSNGGDVHPIIGLSNFRPRYIDWGPRSEQNGQEEDDD
jgi:Tol biopolymer transport system component